jgi:hypothetical protein
VAPKQNSLYDAAVQASVKYLGPAGERFLRRQIAMHLKIEPEKLSSRDLEKLISWMKLAFAMLTNNQNHVEAFVDDLCELVGKTTSKSTRNGYAKN